MQPTSLHRPRRPRPRVSRENGCLPASLPPPWRFQRHADWTVLYLTTTLTQLQVLSGPRVPGRHFAAVSFSACRGRASPRAMRGSRERPRPSSQDCRSRAGPLERITDAPTDRYRQRLDIAGLLPEPGMNLRMLVRGVGMAGRARDPVLAELQFGPRRATGLRHMTADPYTATQVSADNIHASQGGGRPGPPPCSPSEENPTGDSP